MEMSTSHPLYLGNVTCLLFCGVRVAGTDEFDDTLNIFDLSPCAAQHLQLDCAEFVAKAGALLAGLDLHQCGMDLHCDREGDGTGLLERVGMDLHYDREGCGTGFLERVEELPAVTRTALHALAKTFGQVNAYTEHGIVHLDPVYPRAFEWPALALLVSPPPASPRYRW